MIKINWCDKLIWKSYEKMIHKSECWWKRIDENELMWIILVKIDMKNWYENWYENWCDNWYENFCGNWYENWYEKLIRVLMCIGWIYGNSGNNE